jgi:hypothetical protein
VAPKGQPRADIFHPFTTDHYRFDTMPAGSRQLKPSFNESGQNWSSAPLKGALRGTCRERKPQDRVMATVTSASLSSTAGSGQPSNPFAEIRGFWRQFFSRALDPYRPELHYMRGPGPACRAKHDALSPEVQSILAKIRAAKAVRSPAPL